MGPYDELAVPVTTMEEGDMSAYRVVVGVDGSAEAARALEWAVRETDARGGTVTAVAAWNWDGPSLAKPPLGVNPGQVRAYTEQLMATALADVRAQYPAVAITAKVVQGHAPSVLVEVAKDADLLVLGSHGYGRFHHAVLGSVSEQCVRKATCPVVVVPAAMAAVGAAEPAPTG
jgi:nucleotide-binding universal stress UspA family protein